MGLLGFFNKERASISLIDPLKALIVAIVSKTPRLVGFLRQSERRIFLDGSWKSPRLIKNKSATALRPSCL